ncbi:hypothetical protein FA95DRAFT_1024664 [Auriscalpium vulgare]|uniref:Uncharacterized protein n=1 Tax=Auriscalpium vulgare TaxID=40419 RepID=A0ACB8RYE0_9AGAM|nr:hypothetical protein FA95DRAFT_1024664 [Auriscalpium vulgare]
MLLLGWICINAGRPQGKSTKAGLPSCVGRTERSGESPDCRFFEHNLQCSCPGRTVLARARRLVLTTVCSSFASDHGQSASRTRLRAARYSSQCPRAGRALWCQVCARRIDVASGRLRLRPLLNPLPAPRACGDFLAAADPRGTALFPPSYWEWRGPGIAHAHRASLPPCDAPHRKLHSPTVPRGARHAPDTSCTPSPRRIPCTGSTLIVSRLPPNPFSSHPKSATAPPKARHQYCSTVGIPR